MIFNKHAVKLFPLLSFLFIFIFLATPLSAQKKRGKVTTKYANGVTESSGKVKHYKKQGVWKYWSEDGALVKTVTYKDDVKEGLYTEYYPGGKKSAEGVFTSNLKTGTWNTWYNDGKLSSKLNYTADYLSKTGDVYNGLQQWWYENGQLREQSEYNNGKLFPAKLGIRMEKSARSKITRTEFLKARGGNILSLLNRTTHFHRRLIITRTEKRMAFISVTHTVACRKKFIIKTIC
jgi:hypothetical protein